MVLIGGNASDLEYQDSADYPRVWKLNQELPRP